MKMVTMKAMWLIIKLKGLDFIVILYLIVTIQENGIGIVRMAGEKKSTILIDHSIVDSSATDSNRVLA